MMKKLRRQLGPSYTTWPARIVGDYLGDKLYKVIMTIFCCALWTVFYFVIVCVVNFCRENFQEGAVEMSNYQCFRTDLSMWILLATYVIIFLIVLRSRRGETVRRRVENRELVRR